MWRSWRACVVAFSLVLGRCVWDGEETNRVAGGVWNKVGYVGFVSWGVV